MSKIRKTIIGVLASHDDPYKNEQLADLLQRLRPAPGEKLCLFPGAWCALYGLF